MADPAVPADSGFSSTATTPGGVMNDLYQFGVRSLQAVGRIPASLGTNSPLPQINSSSDLLDAFESHFAQQRQAQGGSAVDTPYTPGDQTYVAQRRQLLQAEEGYRTLAYDDATDRAVTAGPVRGKVTVGIGFNMDQPDARNYWAQAFGPNGPNFDAVHAGKTALTDAQVNGLFDWSMAHVYEPIVDQKFAGIDLTNHQRLALVSACYNGPGLLNPVAAAWKTGGAAAAQQALVRGNGNPVLASRRQREATLFAGMDLPHGPAVAQANPPLTPPTQQTADAGAVVNPTPGGTDETHLA